LISLPQHLPLLRIGDLPLAPFEGDWLRRNIEQAAREAGHCGEWWPAEDIARGVVLYLRDSFDGSVICLEELFAKVHEALLRIGCGEIADCLRPEPPPVRLSLLEIAKDAGNGFELLFFQLLRQRLTLLQKHRVSRVQFFGLKPCVKLLRAAKHWRHDCDLLYREILLFMRTHSRTTYGPTLSISVST